MADVRYLNLFRQNNIAGTFRGANVINGKMITGAKDSIVPKENADYFVSISDKAHDMLERLYEEKKRSESDLVSGNKDSVTNANGIEPRVLEAYRDPSCYTGRLLSAAYRMNEYQDGDPNKRGGKPDFDMFAFAYAEIRDEMKSQYTGRELERYLEQLDAHYEYALDYIVHSVKSIINYSGVVDGKEAAIKSLEWVFGKDRGELGFLIEKMGDKKTNLFNQSFWDSVEAYVRSLAQTAMERYK
jgi:hypothetical protein